MKRRAYKGAELTRILVRANPVPPGTHAGWARRGRGRRILEDIVRRPVQEHPPEKRIRRPAAFLFAGALLVTALAVVPLATHWVTVFPGLPPTVHSTGVDSATVTVPETAPPSASANTGQQNQGVSGPSAFDDGSSSAESALVSRFRNASVVVRGEISGIAPLVTLHVEEWLKGRDPVATLRLHLVGAVSKDGSAFMLSTGSLSDPWLDHGAGTIAAAPLRIGDVLVVVLDAEPMRESRTDTADVWIVDPAESVFIAKNGVFGPVVTTDGARGVTFTEAGIRRLAKSARRLERAR